MKRSAIFLLLAGFVIALFSSPAGASPPLTVLINGSVVSSPTDMNVIEGQVMVPLRWAAGQLGASSVEWEAATRTVTIKTSQDFYYTEKLASYDRGLQVNIDEQDEQIWPLPDKAKNLPPSDLVSNRQWVLTLPQFNTEKADPTQPGHHDSITIHIVSDDGIYDHSSVAYSIENRQGHYYLPMDWLEYLFKAKVNYDQAGHILSIQTPDMDKMKSAIAVTESALIPSSADEAIKLWGRGEQTRNGALQYAALSPPLRQQADESDYIRQSYWVTGFSSPRVGPITIASRNEVSAARIEYTLTFPEITSVPPHTTATEKLVVEKLQNDGREGWFITQVLQSSGYGIIEGDTFQWDAKDIDIDKDGKDETVQLMANNNRQQWELIVKKDDMVGVAEIFLGDSKGFSASIVAAGHIIGSDTMDILLATDYRSMPFGGSGYELYSWQDRTLTRIDLSRVTQGTPFSIEVDENNKSAKIAANGAAVAVSLSDWDLHDYKLYGNEFCQNFFIAINLPNMLGEGLAEIVTTEVIAATLPQSLTYLHTTYKYVNGNWKAIKTEFANLP